MMGVGDGDGDHVAAAARTDVGLSDDLRARRRARAIRRGGLLALLLVVALGATGVLGVRTGEVSATADGYELTVTYAEVTRAGLATPWEVTIRRPGGFPGPVQVATTSGYFDLFDENGLDPEPAASTTTDELTVWEFDPPDGEVLTISLDARLSPATQRGASAMTSILDGDRPVVTVTYRTRVMP